MTMIGARSAWGLVVLGCGCGDPRPSVGLFGEGGGSDDGTSSASAGTHDAGDDGDDGDDDSGVGTADETSGPKFDVGDEDTGIDPGCVEGDCGCTAVDILFVIDDSTSMGSYQQGLAAAAPDFADAIFASLPPGTDLHVGVTTSSFYGGSGGTSPGETNCSPYYEGAGLTDRDDLFQWYWTPDDMPYDANGAQGRLRVHEGLTYFATTTDGDPSAMKDWLVGNITAVGEHGSVWEMVAAGAAYPFHPANAAHNAGFLRDQGAVLVILTLTDEVDNSPEDVQTYHDMIAAAKAGCGGDDCIVTAGIHKPCLATAPDNVLYPLLASFGEEPAVADIGPELDDCFDDCADGDIVQCDAVNPPVTCAELLAGGGTQQYADALGGALAQVIAQTCAEIPPAG
jgi:hypothetical protein